MSEQLVALGEHLTLPERGRCCDASLEGPPIALALTMARSIERTSQEPSHVPAEGRWDIGGHSSSRTKGQDILAVTPTSRDASRQTVEGPNAGVLTGRPVVSCYVVVY